MFWGVKPAWKHFIAWWRHHMETFSALLAICAGNSPVTGEFPAQRPVTRSFNIFVDLRLDKRLNKQSWGWWFETLSRPLWRHSNGLLTGLQVITNLCDRWVIVVVDLLRIKPYIDSSSHNEMRKLCCYGNQYGRKRAVLMLTSLNGYDYSGVPVR